jgi:hypothetical protein
MFQQARSNIQAPPRILQDLAAAAEYLWQLYREIALSPRILGATFVLKDAALQVAVDLEVDQGDTDYQVFIMPFARTGAPAANSDQISTIKKERKRFTVTFKAAPGAGNSITFDWLTRR